MLGAAFRKDPVIDLARFRPPKGRAFVGDTDLAGTPLVAFAEDVVREQISKGRVGLLVDYSNGAGRAFIARYTAEAVVNRSEEHTSELQSLMRISYAAFC